MDVAKTQPGQSDLANRKDYGRSLAFTASLSLPLSPPPPPPFGVGVGVCVWGGLGGGVWEAGGRLGIATHVTRPGPVSYCAGLPRKSYGEISHEPVSNQKGCNALEGGDRGGADAHGQPALVNLRVDGTSVLWRYIEGCQAAKEDECLFLAHRGSNQVPLG